MKRIILPLALAIMALPAVALAGTWNIDPVHSSVGFQIRHMFSKVNGSFTEYSGTISYDPDNPENSSIEVVIVAASITTNNEKRDGHLQSEEFFWVEENPEITFKSTKVTQKGDMHMNEGLLTMRGKENPAVLEAEFLGSGMDAWGNNRGGFSATTKVDRKEWGITYNKTLDKGGALLGDEVTITLEISALLQVEESEE
jgi:polyisoprenoid-binding protein YceI